MRTIGLIVTKDKAESKSNKDVKNTKDKAESKNTEVLEDAKVQE